MTIIAPSEKLNSPTKTSSSTSTSKDKYVIAPSEPLSDVLEAKKNMVNKKRVVPFIVCVVIVIIAMSFIVQPTIVETETKILAFVTLPTGYDLNSYAVSIGSTPEKIIDGVIPYEHQRQYVEVVYR